MMKLLHRKFAKTVNFQIFFVKLPFNKIDLGYLLFKLVIQFNLYLSRILSRFLFVPWLKWRHLFGGRSIGDFLVC